TLFRSLLQKQKAERTTNSRGFSKNHTMTMTSSANLQNFEHAHLELDLNKILFCTNLETNEIVYEEWRDIPNYIGYFQVSSFGRVKSLDRIIKDKNGITFNKKGKCKKLYLRPDGYTSCIVSKKGKNKRYNTHQLVAMAF